MGTHRCAVPLPGRASCFHDTVTKPVTTDRPESAVFSQMQINVVSERGSNNAKQTVLAYRRYKRSDVLSSNHHAIERISTNRCHLNHLTCAAKLYESEFEDNPLQSS